MVTAENPPSSLQESDDEDCAVEAGLTSEWFQKVETLPLQELVRVRGTQRMRLTKFRKSLTTIREQLRVQDDDDTEELHKSEETFEELVAEAQEKIEFATNLIDELRQRHAVARARERSSSSASKCTLKTQQQTRSVIQPTRIPVVLPGITPVQSSAPVIAAPIPPTIDEEIDEDDFCHLEGSVLRQAPQLDPRVAEQVSMIEQACLTPQEFSKYGNLSSLCDTDFDLSFHIENFEEWLVNIKAAYRSDNVVIVPESIKFMVVDSFIRSLGTNSKIVSSTRDLAKIHKFSWRSVAQGLKQRFCDSQTLVQSYEALRSKLTLKDVSGCEEYISKARLVFAAFNSVWKEDGAERRSLIKTLVQQLSPTIKSGVCQRLVELCTDLSSNGLWYDCSFENYLLSVRRTCLTMQASGEIDKVHKITPNPGQKGTTFSMAKWVDERLSKGQCVKVVTTKFTDAHLQKIKESSGFVDYKEGRGKVSKSPYLVVVFADAQAADMALEKAQIEGRSWSQGKGLGRRN